MMRNRNIGWNPCTAVWYGPRGVVENCVIAGNNDPSLTGDAAMTNRFFQCTTDGGAALNETCNTDNGCHEYQHLSGTLLMVR